MNYYFEAWKKYAVFSGRATRSEFWYFTLFSFIISIVLDVLSSALGSSVSLNFWNYLPLIYGLAVLLPALGVGVRRLHDTNRSGWWILINLIPFIGLIIYIVFCAQDSQPGDNQYGPNPKPVVAS